MTTTPRLVLSAFTFLVTVAASFTANSSVHVFAAEHLTFRGSFTLEKSEPGMEARKTFQLHVVELPDHPPRDAWCLVESAPGGFAWTERVNVGPTESAAIKHHPHPALLFDRGDGLSEVPLPPHRIPADQPLAPDATWQAGQWTYKVVGAGEGAGFPAWKIVVSNNSGPRQTLWVEKGSTLIVACQARVFIGRGVECHLTWELADRVALDDAAASKIHAQFTAFTNLRDELALQPAELDVPWKPGQLEKFLAAYPKLKPQLTFAPLVELAQVAEQDAQTQSQRSDSLAALQKQALGKTLEKFKLQGTAGEELTSAALPNHVTVLHFWDYRDTPLEAPYGQVGYLDFLARAKKQGVEVYGVVVDERLSDPNTRRQALTSAKKTKAFMNLSYPVLLDDAGLLDQLGDPRAAGAKLPLWIVLDKQGRVAHYHVGFYEVNRDRGLAELTAAVEQALAKD
jgi:alkyl hydroperoxide reductase subunit AhpC